MKKASIVVALGFLLTHTFVDADTGFLDRAVTIGTTTHRYQVYVPAEHTNAKLWPVIVDLHGGGSQGPDGLRQTAQGLAQQIRLNRSRFPVVVVFPQAEVGKWWLSGDMEELVIAELDRTVSEFGGDPARLYLTGFSMGATGAYRIAYRWPTRFAALATIAGRIDTFDQPDDEREADRKTNPFVTVADPFAALATKLKPIPMRVFHGDGDERVPVEHSRRLWRRSRRRERTFGTRSTLEPRTSVQPESPTPKRISSRGFLPSAGDDMLRKFAGIKDLRS